jgi:hypothetical protein
MPAATQRFTILERNINASFRAHSVALDGTGHFAGHFVGHEIPEDQVVLSVGEDHIAAGADRLTAPLAATFEKDLVARCELALVDFLCRFPCRSRRPAVAGIIALRADLEFSRVGRTCKGHGTG